MKSRTQGSSAVLVVDDDEAIRKLYQTVLGRRGFEVETAADGGDGLKRIAERSFDVIITDLAMPVMNGMDFLRAVRHIDLDVPVILLTGSPGFDSAVTAVEYGAFRYLVKPIEQSVLVDAVTKAGHLHRLAILKREMIGMDGLEGMRLGDRASLDARFSGGLAGLWVAFQPIVDWSARRVFGYEALVRSHDSAMPGPADLFDAAERLGRVHQLGRAIRREAAESAISAPDDAHLFVNVNADELNDDELYSRHAPLSKWADRVVLEITERVALESVTGLSQKIGQLRSMGYRIAIDDLGAGYAGLNSFTLLEPDFVKLDMTLVRGIDQSPKKRTIVKGISQLCKTDLGIQVVCEGVERCSEREALAEEGLTLFQGYLFARPAAGFPIAAWA